MEQILLRAQPLTARAFAPFGEVIETAGHTPRWINEGTSQRFDDLAHVDVSEDGGRPVISIFKALPRPLPLPIQVLERHPQSSQAFFPLEQLPFLVVVAEDGGTPLAQRVRAFRTAGLQGVNYRRNTWHHALIALNRAVHFLVVDRAGPGENCEQQTIDDVHVLLAEND
jgi:ureidoglycolate lyase